MTRKRPIDNTDFIDRAARRINEIIDQDKLDLRKIDTSDDRLYGPTKFTVEDFENRLFKLAERLEIDFPPPPYTTRVHKELLSRIGWHFAFQQPEFKRGPGKPKGTKHPEGIGHNSLSKEPGAKRQRGRRERKRQQEASEQLRRRINAEPRLGMRRRDKVRLERILKKEGY
jgi:hypothetical protein